MPIHVRKRTHTYSQKAHTESNGNQIRRTLRRFTDNLFMWCRRDERTKDERLSRIDIGKIGFFFVFAAVRYARVRDRLISAFFFLFVHAIKRRSV